MLWVPKALACLWCLFCFETQPFSSKKEKKEIVLSVNITVNPVPGMVWPSLHFHFLCKKLEEVETKVNVPLFFFFCCCSSVFLSRKLPDQSLLSVFIRMVPSPSHNLCPREGESRWRQCSEGEPHLGCLEHYNVPTWVNSTVGLDFYLLSDTCFWVT